MITLTFHFGVPSPCCFRRSFLPTLTFTFGFPGPKFGVRLPTLTFTFGFPSLPLLRGGGAAAATSADVDVVHGVSHIVAQRENDGSTANARFILRRDTCAAYRRTLRERVRERVICNDLLRRTCGGEGRRRAHTCVGEENEGELRMRSMGADAAERTLPRA